MYPQGSIFELLRWDFEFFNRFFVARLQHLRCVDGRLTNWKRFEFSNTRSVRSSIYDRINVYIETGNTILDGNQQQVKESTDYINVNGNSKIYYSAIPSAYHFDRDCINLQSISASLRRNSTSTSIQDFLVVQLDNLVINHLLTPLLFLFSRCILILFSILSAHN